MPELIETTVEGMKALLEEYGIDTTDVVIRDGYDFKLELSISSRNPLGDQTKVHEEFTIVRIIKEEKKDGEK